MSSKFLLTSFMVTINSHPGISADMCFHMLFNDPYEKNHIEGFFFPLMNYLPGGKILNFLFLLNAC